MVIKNVPVSNSWENVPKRLSFNYLLIVLCRWKAVSLSDAKGGLLVFGGDPLDFNGIGRIYLNDLWHLNFKEDPATPYWEQIHYAGGQYSTKSSKFARCQRTLSSLTSKSLTQKTILNVVCLPSSSAPELKTSA